MELCLSVFVLGDDDIVLGPLLLLEIGLLVLHFFHHTFVKQPLVLNFFFHDLNLVPCGINFVIWHINSSQNVWLLIRFET